MAEKVPETDPATLQPASDREPADTSLERFLRAIEEKTQSPLHRRLLAACRNEDPSSALEATLQAAIVEALHEA